MTEAERSDTPISNALSASQDGMADALLAADGTPESRLRILNAWREHNAAQSNAQSASLNSIVRYVEQFLIDVESRISDRITNLSNERRKDMSNLAAQIDSQHQDTIDRIHSINNKMQGFVEITHEQAQFASQLEQRIDGNDERLDRHEDRVTALTVRINQMSRELKAIREHIKMPEPAELDVQLMPVDEGSAV